MSVDPSHADLAPIRRPGQGPACRPAVRPPMMSWAERRSREPAPMVGLVLWGIAAEIDPRMKGKKGRESE
jgi:hypothetical protein